MLFNTFTFLLVFLPASIVGYAVLTRVQRGKWCNVWLVCCSLWFYAQWRPWDLVIFSISILLNFWLSKALQKGSGATPVRRAWLGAGILVNAGMLVYFKYTGFFLESLNGLLHTSFVITQIVLPLGISFFTFQQMAFLVDCYRGHGKRYSFVDYALFVSFFPQLIAGPIVHHSEMMPQFAEGVKRPPKGGDLSAGVLLLAIGLAKKVLIADTLAIWTEGGYRNVAFLDGTAAWLCIFTAFLRVYFDFSGYTDMAMGAARLFGITLPANFDSPFKAASVGEFWRRWHITLGRWMRSYVYFPLGGSHVSALKLIRNLIVTFVFVGLWHGASWTYVVFGLTHGAAVCVERLFRRLKLVPPKAVAWITTYVFLHLSLVFFDADSWTQACAMLKALTGLNDGFLAVDVTYSVSLIQGGVITLPVIAVLHAVVLTAPNSNQLAARVRPGFVYWVVVLSMTLASSVKMCFPNSLAEFVYFQF